MPATEAPREIIRMLYLISETGSALRQLDEIARLAAVRVDLIPGIERRENVQVLDVFRLALHYTASVSRMIWPSPWEKDKDRALKARERGRYMIALLNLPDDHILRSRHLRNYIEHMDEWLDTWAAPSHRPFHAFSTVLHEHLLTEDARTDVIDSTFLVLEPEQGRIHVMGKQFLLSDLRVGLEDVQARASLAMERSFQ